MRDYQDSLHTTSMSCLNLNHEPGVALVVRIEHLYCPVCGSKRMWVHNGIAGGSWRVIELDQAGQVEALITRWHDGEGDGQDLHTWLGMTWEAYGTWVATTEVPEGYRAPRRSRSSSTSTRATRS